MPTGELVRLFAKQFLRLDGFHGLGFELSFYRAGEVDRSGMLNKNDHFDAGVARTVWRVEWVRAEKKSWFGWHTDTTVPLVRRRPLALAQVALMKTQCRVVLAPARDSHCSARINCFHTGTMAYAFIAIRSPSSNFSRNCLLVCPTRAMDVVTAVITGQGECEMTTSITEHQPASQATAAADKEVPKKAHTGARQPRVPPTRAKSASQATPAKKPAKSRQKPAVARQGSKTAKVVDLLNRSGGATLKEILRATGWQPHSVRGFISGHLGKKMGLIVRSFRRDGERVYALKG